MSIEKGTIFTDEKVRESVTNVYRDAEDDRIKSWLKCPPMYTTVRVNFPKDVLVAQQELQDIVTKNYIFRDQCAPEVYVHHLIKDLLVIPSPPVTSTKNKPSKEVIVDVYCGSAVLRGANIFAPGIIGAPPDLKAHDTVAVYADLSGKCLKGWMKNYDGPKLYLGNGTATCSRQDLFNNNNNKNISGVAVQMKETLGNCPSLGDNVLGSQMILQNLPSVVCCHVLNPKPSDLVLDMCAAPGGKTTHIASIMQNEGMVIALDKTKPRVAKLKLNVELSGYKNVSVFQFDSTKALNMCALKLDFSFITQPPPYPANTFDKILLDTPCSALGQRPQLINKMTAKDLEAYPQLQRKLFSVAVQLLKPGGVLVYSTCSLSLDENEHVVAWALDKHPHIRLCTQTPRLGGPGHKVSGLSPEDVEKLQRFDMNSPGQGEDADTI